MIAGEEYTVNIEKMINGGSGLARVNDFPVFIENACCGDTLRIKIKKINNSYATGEIVRIESPSKSRIKPQCALSGVCGSCDWLHIAYEEQLLQKRNIVFETIKKITGKDYKINSTIASPEIKEYRCKVQYPVSQRKTGRIVAGYYKKNSHELINIKFCPMHNPLISNILEFIKDNAQKLNIDAYNEKKHKGLIRHIVFRESSYNKDIIIIFVINSETISEKLLKLSKLILEHFSFIKGICANFNTKKTNVIFSDKTGTIFGNDYYIEQLDNIKYKISANSFFQVNPKCAKIIFNTVKTLINERISMPEVLDAYSGVSSFGIWLSSISSSVTCIEEVKSSSNNAIENIKLNNCKNITVINSDAEKEFERLVKNNVKFDVCIIDPPRKGCNSGALQNLLKLSRKYLVYVSCNVSTLARDIKIITECDFVPEVIQPVDMFPNTYHTEVIVLFSKKNI